MRTFFFPLIGGDTNIINYIQDYFDWPVPLGNFAWEYILIFLLATVCVAWYVAIKRTKEYSQKEGAIISLIGGMACTGIVAFTYYMNEPLWTDLVVYKHIVYGLFVVFLGKIYRWLKEDAYPRIGDQFIRVFGLMMIAVAVCGAIQVMNDPVRIASRKWSGAYDAVSLNIAVSQLDISEDTYGMGQGVNMVYHMLEMNNHTKFRDTSELDMPYSETFEKVITELQQNEMILINSNNPYDQETLSKLQVRGFVFTPVRSFQIGIWEYTYCRIDYNRE